MKVLVVGNGTTRFNSKSQYFINRHTGKMLLKIKDEHEVSFAQRCKKLGDNIDLADFELSKQEIKHIDVNPKSLYNLSRFFFELFKYEFVYIFFPGTLSRIVSIFCILTRKRFGLYVRGQFFMQNKSDRLILKSAAFILTVSPQFVEQLSRYCSDVEIIKPMIEIELADIVPHKGYFNEPLKLLFVGRVEARKGIYELFEIYEYLTLNGINFELNIVGGGDLFEFCKKEIERQKAENIILHGMISDRQVLHALYETADIFIFPSYDEGFPRVLYEAMAHSIPIFTTFVGGIPGRMIDNVNCIEIPVKNGSESAKIIRYYIDNKAKLISLADGGRETLVYILDNLKLHEAMLLSKI